MKYFTNLNEVKNHESKTQRIEGLHGKQQHPHSIGLLEVLYELSRIFNCSLWINMHRL